MGTKVVITREQLEAHKPCSSTYFEDSPRWDGYALVYEDVDAEIARLAAIPGAIALIFLTKANLLPNFGIMDCAAAIKKANTAK